MKKHPSPIFKGTIKSGKVIYDDPQARFMYLCSLEGQRVEETVKKEQKKKSNKQNKYYRAVVLPMIAKQYGEYPKAMHGILQFEFFLYTNDKGQKYIRSTELKEWDTLEWEEKMSEIRQWASEELGLYIPLPNEMDF